MRSNGPPEDVVGEGLGPPTRRTAANQTVFFLIFFCFISCDVFDCFMQQVVYFLYILLCFSCFYAVFSYCYAMCYFLCYVLPFSCSLVNLNYLF